MKNNLKRGNPREKQSSDFVQITSDSKNQNSGVEFYRSGSEKDYDVTTVGRVRRQTRSDRRRAETKQRRQETKAGVRKKKPINKTKVIISVVIVLIIAAVGAYFGIQASGALNIETVEYVGARHLTEAECEALSPSPVGQSLLTFDSSSIEKSFLRDSWVESVTFERDFPHNLKIVIHEKEIGAVVDFTVGSKQTSQSWIVTLDGTWIMAIPDSGSELASSISPNIYTDAENAVHITDCPNGISPEIGGKCTDQTVLNALSILSGFTTDLGSQVKSISAGSVSATTLKLSSNIEVAFGAADQIREKERIVKEIIEQNDKVVYINVRTVDRPTWRAA